MDGNNHAVSCTSNLKNPMQSQRANKESGHIDTDSVTHSAYQSLADSSTSSSATEQPSAAATPTPTLRSLNESDLCLFKKAPIHDSQFRHFASVKPLLEARLQSEVFTFGYEPWHSIAIHAKVLGIRARRRRTHCRALPAVSGRSCKTGTSYGRDSGFSYCASYLHGLTTPRHTQTTVLHDCDAGC